MPLVHVYLIIKSELTVKYPSVNVSVSNNETRFALWNDSTEMMCIVEWRYRNVVHCEMTTK